ncbi:hypothetical protein EW146_g7641 [Bondarzewia mesenterica]|uniref:Uncharacterized protein n=1 Tax=Bondarzewia mesenterica TaxID=1095465 RepID=A0A4S4LKU1_9AGAM|nr:hypothetical protein EW146_g7641 [Bondarzewia mesenterica]
MRNSTRPAAQAPSDVGSPRGSMAPAEEGKDGESGETVENVKVPERRSTRSRAALARSVQAARRTSSASDGTQTSVSVSAAVAASRSKEANGKEKDKAEVDVEMGERRPANDGTAEAKDADVVMVVREQNVGKDEDNQAKEVEESDQSLKDEAEKLLPVPSEPPVAEDDQKEEGEISEEGELPSKS